jgi:hypothetical protein
MGLAGAIMPKPLNPARMGLDLKKLRANYGKNYGKNL